MIKVGKMGWEEKEDMKGNNRKKMSEHGGIQWGVVQWKKE